jgi:hypothetical protein
VFPDVEKKLRNVMTTTLLKGLSEQDGRGQRQRINKRDSRLPREGVTEENWLARDQQQDDFQLSKGLKEKPILTTAAVGKCLFLKGPGSEIGNNGPDEFDE